MSKKYFRNLLLIIIIFSLIIPSHSFVKTDETNAADTYGFASGWFYRITGSDTVTIRPAVSGDLPKRVVIPSSLVIEGKTYTVTRLADDAFTYCYCDQCIRRDGNKLEQIWREGSNEIKAHEEIQVNLVDEVVVPSTVEVIGDAAFDYLWSLKTLTLKQTSKLTLGEDVFYDEVNLTTINIENYSIYQKIIDSVYSEKTINFISKKTRLYINNKSKGDISIPNEEKDIDISEFAPVGKHYVLTDYEYIKSNEGRKAVDNCKNNIITSKGYPAIWANVNVLDNVYYIKGDKHGAISTVAGNESDKAFDSKKNGYAVTYDDNITFAKKEDLKNTDDNLEYLGIVIRDSKGKKIGEFDFGDKVSKLSEEHEDELTIELKTKEKAKPQYTLAYNLNAGDAQGGPIGSELYKYDEAVTVSSEVPTRPDFYFDGWCTSSDGTGTMYKSSQSIAAGWVSEGTEKVTLYAIWKPYKKAKITIRPNKASKDITGFQVSYSKNGGSILKNQTYTNLDKEIVYRINGLKSGDTVEVIARSYHFEKGKKSLGPKNVKTVTVP